MKKSKEQYKVYESLDSKNKQKWKFKNQNKHLFRKITMQRKSLMTLRIFKPNLH